MKSVNLFILSIFIFLASLSTVVAVDTFVYGNLAVQNNTRVLNNINTTGGHYFGNNSLPFGGTCATGELAVYNASQDNWKCDREVFLTQPLTATYVTATNGIFGNITINAQFTGNSSIIPELNNTYDLGATTPEDKFWRALYVGVINVVTQLTDSQISNQLTANASLLTSIRTLDNKINLDWANITNKFITSVTDPWLSVTSGVLEFNETHNNKSVRILARAVNPWSNNSREVFVKSGFPVQVNITKLRVTENGTINKFLDFIATASNPSSPPAGVTRLHSATINGFTRIEQDNEATTNIILGRDSVFVARNDEAGTIRKGQVVYVIGGVGNSPRVKLAQSNSTNTLPSIAIAVDDVSTNQFGQFMILGVIMSLDTSSFAEGDRLFISPTQKGNLTITRPAYPNYAQRIGSVLVSHSSQGQLYISVAPFIGGEESGTRKTTYTFAGNATSVGWFFGKFSWFIKSGVSQKYLNFNGTHLSYNETKLNNTIKSTGQIFNESLGIQKINTTERNNNITQAAEILANRNRIGVVNTTMIRSNSSQRDFLRKLNSTKANMGTCASGYAIQNATNTSVQCIAIVTDLFVNATGDTMYGNLIMNGTSNVTANWFFGKFDWAIKSGVSANYLTFNGTTQTFNEAFLNSTIQALSDNRWSITGSRWIYNDSGHLEVNETLLNETFATASNVSTRVAKVGDTMTGLLDMDLDSGETAIKLNHTNRLTFEQDNGDSNASLYNENGNLIIENIQGGNTTLNTHVNPYTTGTFSLGQSGLKFLNVWATNFHGRYDWNITFDESQKYLRFNGTRLAFNETMLNLTINDTINGRITDFDDYINVGGDSAMPNSVFRWDFSNFTYINAIHGDLTFNNTLNFNTHSIFNFTSIRLGIGTLFPSHTLTVVGNANITGDVIANAFNGSLNTGTISITADIDDEHIEGDLNTYVDIAGDIMTGNLNMTYSNITEVGRLEFTNRTGTEHGVIYWDEATLRLVIQVR